MSMVGGCCGCLSFRCVFYRRLISDGASKGIFATWTHTTASTQTQGTSQNSIPVCMFNLYCYMCLHPSVPLVWLDRWLFVGSNCCTNRWYRCRGGLAAPGPELLFLYGFLALVLCVLGVGYPVFRFVLKRLSQLSFFR